jgi:hypothetical protein
MVQLLKGFVTKLFIFSMIVSALFFSTLNGQSQERRINDVGPATEDVVKEKYTEIFYISQTTGSDESGDGSQHYPWKTLGYALNNVKTINLSAIYVAEGRYSEETITLKPFIDLFGGFQSETWKRDIFKYPTILDGENSHRVLIGADNARVDGFIITNGQAQAHGGGILCEDTSPTISNCFIVKNYVSEPPDFNYNRIHQEGHHGAGIACLYNAVPVVRNNIFYMNQTAIGNGAGIAFYGWFRKDDAPATEIRHNAMEGGLRPVVKNNVFVQNISGVKDLNRTRSSNGGAISCAYEARPVIENNIIAHNQAKGRSDAGGIYSEYFSYPLINSNWIVGNTSDDDGGGMYMMRLGHAVITNNFIAGNKTLGNGVGGIRLSKEGRALVTGNIIVQNLTGGAVQCVDSYIEMTNNIIMHNSGATSVSYRSYFTYFKPSLFESNIIQENEGIPFIESKNEDDVILKNNVFDEEKSGTKNANAEISIIDDSADLKIKKAFFDESHYKTLIEIESPVDLKIFTGRVVNIGDQWSVISEVKDNVVYIWGNLEKDVTETSVLKVISSYQANNGEQSAN